MTGRQFLGLLFCTQAVSSAFSVLVAVVVSYYFSYSNEYWMVLTAFLVNQTTQGTPVKQGMLLFINIIMAIIVSSFMVMTIKSNYLIYISLSIVFIAGSHLGFVMERQENKRFLLIILFSIVMLISTLSPTPSGDYMQNRVFDSAIGALIGILAGMIILPATLSDEFSKGVVPILRSLHDYAKVLRENMLSTRVLDKSALQHKINIEDALQTQQGMYPEWVYETGFNRGLRSGLRFFLVHLERVTELFFSMEFLLSRKIDLSIYQSLEHEIEKVMLGNQELLDILIHYFMHKKIKEFSSDFTSDVADLEKSLQRLVPSSLELLDVSADSLAIISFVRDLREIRTILLQLVMALQVV